jgi:ectoine hydroxylase-related dioxygenase (phytanoyl-CoA dioxygenase family)
MSLAQIEHDGFELVPKLFSETEARKIAALLDSEVESLRGSRRGGTRDVLSRLPALRELAERPAILKIVCEVLGDGVFVVRATLFDKTPEANWKVPWHQDVTIAVKERRETAGYTPWSMKEGVVHVQPPTEVLENILTVRVHLDRCSARNGALRVIPGSHRLGRLDQNKVGAAVDESRSICCSANAGDALIMRPLLLHASSASAEPTHRRVLHFDYAVGDLAGGLQWKMRDYSAPTLRQR